jgi:hypothetical protein
MAVSKPICVGAACNSTAADRGNASKVTWPPNDEINIEVHRRRYVASRSKSVGASAKRDKRLDRDKLFYFENQTVANAMASDSELYGVPRPMKNSRLSLLT